MYSVKYLISSIVFPKQQKVICYFSYFEASATTSSRSLVVSRVAVYSAQCDSLPVQTTINDILVCLSPRWASDFSFLMCRV